jgi:hypothetical protein
MTPFRIALLRSNRCGLGGGEKNALKQRQELVSFQGQSFSRSRLLFLPSKSLSNALLVFSTQILQAYQILHRQLLINWQAFSVQQISMGCEVNQLFHSFEEFSQVSEPKNWNFKTKGSFDNLTRRTFALWIFAQRGTTFGIL